MQPHFSSGCRTVKFIRSFTGNYFQNHRLHIYIYIFFFGQLICNKIKSTMANFTVLFLLVICAFVLVNVQAANNFEEKQTLGQTFEEVIVSSDLNVRRKSKENRQGKKLLTNIPQGTTSQTGNPTVSRLISDDGSRVIPVKRYRRGISSHNRFNLGAAEYLLHSSN